MTEVTKRSELLFCYDVTNANPNGDPIDGNKPRIDEETGVNFVTDVRLKRTIRDYLFEYKGYSEDEVKDIFVREKFMNANDPSKGIQDGKARGKDYKSDYKKVLEACIDVRLFGAVIPLDKDSITFTGPVQFKVGQSLHPVELRHIQGTGAFASTAGSNQKTFREEYMLPYSFIAFHGIINEVAAKHTNLTEEDVIELINGMWNGTKNLITRSKFGQMPRVLIKVDYKESGFFIGDLDKKISITGCENLSKIRSVDDFVLDLSKLLNSFEQYKDKIETVHYRFDESLKLNVNVPETWKKIEL